MYSLCIYCSDSVCRAYTVLCEYNSSHFVVSLILTWTRRSVLRTIRWGRRESNAKLFKWAKAARSPLPTEQSATNGTVRHTAADTCTKTLWTADYSDVTVVSGTWPDVGPWEQSADSALAGRWIMSAECWYRTVCDHFVEQRKTTHDADQVVTWHTHNSS